MSYDVFHAPGWHVHALKLDASKAIDVPSSPASAKKFFTIDRWEKGEIEDGRTHFEIELGWLNPTAKPKDMKVEFVRLNGPSSSDDDASKRKGLVVGSEKSGADVVMFMEAIEPGDLPAELVMWQVGSAAPYDDVGVVKVISKVHNPLAELVGKLI